MPAQPRPPQTESRTNENLLLGMPIFEFAPRVGGVLLPYVNLGIVSDASLTKELEEIALESSHSGVRVTVRELITSIKPAFDVTVFNFAPEVLQFSLGSASKVEVSADPAAVVADERVGLSPDPADFLELANGLIDLGSVTVEPATIEGEQIGVGNGTKGAVLGDYALVRKVAAVGDISGPVRVDNAGTVTNYTAVAVGGHGVGNTVEVTVGTGAASGSLQFFVGAGAVNVTGVITATYTPSFALTEGLPAAGDYLVDAKGGRLQVHHDATKAAGTRPLTAGQEVFVSYEYNRLAYTALQPFTQTTFAGAARIRILTDLAGNWVWQIPSAQVKVTDDELAFSDEEFSTGTITITLLDDPIGRFGTLQSYTEEQAQA